MASFSDSSRIPVSSPEGLDSTISQRDKLIWRWVALGVLTLILLVLGVLTYRGAIDNAMLLAYFAALLGALVGAGELIARYRDSPFGSLGRNPSFVYLAVNALAAATAFFLIDTFGWKFEFVSTNLAASGAIQVLVAGFGAMALFRSSLFTARIGEQEVKVGPSIVLDTVLNAADSAVDRESAKGRALTVQRIMRGVDANKAKTVLPLFCQYLRQSNLSDADFTVVKNKVKEIFSEEGGQAGAGADGPGIADDVPDNSKAYLLGLTLLNYMGKDALEAAVQALGKQIKKAPKLHVTDVVEDIDETRGNEVPITYQIRAEDAMGDPLDVQEITCVPPSGSRFVVGETKVVVCEVTDQETGLTTRGTFEVTLRRKAKPSKEVQEESLVRGNGAA